MNKELLLEAPPVYRRFLAGEAASRRLSKRQIATIIGLGALVAVAVIAFTEFQRPESCVSMGVAATIGSLAVAALAAHRLTTRTGVFCGCLYLLNGRMFLSTGTAADHWLAALAAVAMFVFANANLSDRQALPNGNRSKIVFYALVGTVFFVFGPAAAFVVLATCGAFLVIACGRKGLGFLFNWFGLCVLAVAALAAWILPYGHSISDFWPQLFGGGAFSATRVTYIGAEFQHLLTVNIPIDLLPWGPLALVAIFVGIRQGHYSHPFGRFLTVWLATPLVLAAVGLLDRPVAAAVLFPPLVILCGIGLNDIITKRVVS